MSAWRKFALLVLLALCVLPLALAQECDIGSPDACNNNGHCRLDNTCLCNPSHHGRTCQFETKYGGMSDGVMAIAIIGGLLMMPCGLLICFYTVQAFNGAEMPSLSLPTRSRPARSTPAPVTQMATRRVPVAQELRPDPAPSAVTTEGKQTESPAVNEDDLIRQVRDVFGNQKSDAQVRRALQDTNWNMQHAIAALLT